MENMTGWEGLAPPNDACGEAIMFRIGVPKTNLAYHQLYVITMIMNIPILLGWHL